MAEDSDDSQKTEDPTPKRLEDAAKRGEFATSREIGNWLMLAGGALVLVLLAPAMGRDLGRFLIAFLEHPEQIPVDRDGIGALMTAIVSNTAAVIVVPLVVMVVCAIASGLLQHGFRLTPEKLMPKFEHISPAQGAKRLFSQRSVIEFVKGLIKIGIVGAVVGALMVPEFSKVETLIAMGEPDVLRLILHLTSRLMIGVLAVVTLIAALDYLYQRFSFMRSMRMSRQEIKDELKQSEGDPQVRARLRQIRQERARRRMMAAVPEATALITNPTHYAIAIKYDLETMAAPVVTAKGADNVALRMREIAKEHSVPIVEAKPLAQALYAGVEIGQEIPPEHYKAVAEIVGYVFRLQGKLKGQPVRPRAS
jgi:flagellar biosynthetic protein FlhB